MTLSILHDITWHAGVYTMALIVGGMSMAMKRTDEGPVWIVYYIMALVIALVGIKLQ